MSNRFRVFRRRWWLDARCTKPGPGRRLTVTYTATEDEARAVCRAFNCDAEGNRVHRPYGTAYEYERV